MPIWLGPKWNNRDQIDPPSWNKQTTATTTKTSNIWNNSFQDMDFRYQRQWFLGDRTLWLPQLTALREVPSWGARRRNPSRAQLTPWVEETEPKCTELSIREETATQRKHQKIPTSIHPQARKLLKDGEESLKRWWKVIVPYRWPKSTWKDAQHH